MKIEVISKSGNDLTKEPNITKLLGKKVLTKSGFILGNVKEVLFDQKSYSIDGIVAQKYPLFSKKIYIGKEYFQSISEKAVILSIEPAILFIGKKVVDSEGKVLGKAKEIIRQDNSNSVKEIVVKKFLRKSIRIKPSDVKLWGKSIILKDSFGK